MAMGLLVTGAVVVLAARAADEPTPPDGFVSLMGRLTAFVSNTTMAWSKMVRCLGPGTLIWGIPA